MSRTVDKGTAAEFIVLADILERGFVPEIPCSHISTHDITVNGYKVQIKSGTSDGSRVVADIRRPSASDRQYSPTDVDIFAIVDMSTRRVAYLRHEEMTYPRQIKLFVSKVLSRAGMPRDYVPLYFDDYLDIARIVKTEVTSDGAA